MPETSPQLLSISYETRKYQTLTDGGKLRNCFWGNTSPSINRTHTPFCLSCRRSIQESLRHFNKNNVDLMKTFELERRLSRISCKKLTDGPEVIKKLHQWLKLGKNQLISSTRLMIPLVVCHVLVSEAASSKSQAVVTDDSSALSLPSLSSSGTTATLRTSSLLPSR